MIDERQEELAALAAFDLLEGGEKAQFDGEMARNPALRRRVDELRMAANALAHASPVVPPPPGLKDRILASAEARRQVSAPRPVASAKIIPFPVVIAWAAAACFAGALAVTGQMYFSARQHNAVLADQQRAADLQLTITQTRLEAQRLLHERELATLRHDRDQALAAAQAQKAGTAADLAAALEKSRKLSEQLATVSRQVSAAQTQIVALTARMQREGDLAQMKISTLASLLGNTPQAQAVAVWNPARQEGVISLAKLPLAGADKDYELWVIPEGKGATPIAAGLVSIAADGSGRSVFRADKPVAAVAKFAVTLEPKGGGPAPAGKAVLVSE
jgi:anti-sigma-K factor RskA